MTAPLTPRGDDRTGEHTFPESRRRGGTAASGERFGRFTLLGVLGSGGMGVVYRAADRRSGGRWP